MAETPGKPTSTAPVLQGLSMDQLVEVIRALKEPSDEEKQKKAEEVARKKEMAHQAKLAAEQELEQRMGLQQVCIHRNDRRHTFVAQVTGSGDAVAICQICRKDYKWRATADQ